MKAEAIVYTSNTGYTARYAEMLADKTGLNAFPIADAAKNLAKGTTVIYLGWLMAGTVKDYKKASKRYKIAAVCGVGLSDTGSQINEVRTANKLPDGIPLFTIQGGMDRSRLRGINKFMINFLVKMLKEKKDRSGDESAMLALIEKGGSYVREKNLAAVLDWWDNN